MAVTGQVKGQTTRRPALSGKARFQPGDVVEKFVRSGGKGGQNVNKTSTCVYLKHLPTGIEVKCSTERSQARNRQIAYRQLAEKIEAVLERTRKEAVQAAEKERRRKRPRPAALKERILESKKKTASKKRLRAKGIEE
ncbi:MAG: peptide chain release factor-like protein [Nitrospirota bacterium]|nr:peptide chain release factor-like protein [Nitrospirota bacterium]